jgi:putative nucleotidyltransferase with HDIG domain
MRQTMHFEIRRQQKKSVEPQEHILVVDDEPAVLGAVVTLLARGGYEVTPVSSASQALLHLQEGPSCDLILTDVRMPEADGLSLLDAVRENYPGIPVVMLTGSQDTHVAASAFRRGAVDYLLKPVKRDQLLGAVDRALEHGRLLRQNAEYRRSLEDVVSARTNRLRATMQELEKSYDITLEAMGDALDLRDAGTEGHSRRVTAYTIALAREMGLKSEEVRNIARGAYLHDIGKIAMPDRILHKPSGLDSEENDIMRQHCERGYAMVRKIPFLRDASEIVYAHQETFDGSGYPRGLRGDQIPLGARIFAIADTLDAITSDRPYRKARSFAEARAEILRCAGTQFDPHAVEIFLRIPERLWIDLRHEVERGNSGIFGVAV